MAYQPKSYRKFIAGAAAVAVVASAAPVASLAASNFTDVEAKYKDAVDFLVSKGINGTSATTFGTQLNIKRVDAAVFVAQALELDTKNAPDAGFTDVPARAKGAVNALKAANITSGKTTTTFASDQEITRGELAIWLTKAFNLKGGSADLAFTDVSDRYEAAVKALVANEITSGTSATTFGTEASAKRGDFALFIKRAVDATTPAKSGITSVSAINDTKLEVTFGKAIDADVAREIEKDAARFVVYNGGQTANTNGIIKSTYVDFNENYTKATVVISAAPQADINYTVALMDSNNNVTASVVYASEPTVLKTGATQPTLNVNADQDKFVLDFKQKMKDNALTLSNYTIVDENGKAISGVTNLSNLDEKNSVKWVDATTKSAVEFKLVPGVLEAGKTYKVTANSNVKTDKGDVLSDSQKTIKVSTPSLSEAQPTAKFARVSGDKQITVVFDRELTATDTFNDLLIEVKTPTGKTNDVVTSAVKAAGSKELVLTVEESLDQDLTYTVNLPANGVANNVFQNATNNAVSGLTAKAQANTAVASVSAKFQRDVKDKTVADLYLTFDQRVTPTLVTGGVTIESSGKTYTLASGAEVEYDTNDATGKTLRIKNVKSAFGGSFTPELDKSYTVKVAAQTVTTDSSGAIKNQKELKSTISGIDVTAPAIEEVTFESAEKIVVEFDKNIDGNIKAKDVTVLGYKLEKAGAFSKEAVALSDDAYIKVSVSGNKLTITPADNNTKFVTGKEFTAAQGFDATEIVKIKEEKLKGTNGVEAGALVADTDSSDIDFVDNAAPIMVGATVAGVDALEITYSENVVFKDTAAAKANQFSFKGTELTSYGTLAATLAANSNIVAIAFDADNKIADDLIKAKNYPNLEISYSKQASYLIKDALGNEVANAKLVGAVYGTSQ